MSLVTSRVQLASMIKMAKKKTKIKINYKYSRKGKKMILIFTLIDLSVTLTHRNIKTQTGLERDRSLWSNRKILSSGSKLWLSSMELIRNKKIGRFDPKLISFYKHKNVLESWPEWDGSAWPGVNPKQNFVIFSRRLHFALSHSRNKYL